MADYELEIEIDFQGYPSPRVYSKGANEITATQYACVAAVRRLLEDSGYTILRVGHGSRRLDKPEDS